MVILIINDLKITTSIRRNTPLSTHYNIFMLKNHQNPKARNHKQKISSQ